MVSQTGAVSFGLTCGLCSLEVCEGVILNPDIGWVSGSVMAASPQSLSVSSITLASFIGFFVGVKCMATVFPNILDTTSRERRVQIDSGVLSQESGHFW